MKAKGFAINGRFWGKPQTGVERYAREIYSRLGDARLIVPGVKLAGHTGHAWEQLYLPTLLHKDEILWCPANSGPVLVAQQVLTIQDLSPIDHPEWFKAAFSCWYRLLWTILLPRVRAIAVPSLFTKQRVMARFGVPAERIVIVPGGVSASFHPVPRSLSAGVLEHYNLPEGYVLFVGTRQPRKNLERLFLAWSQIQDGYPNLELLVVGGTGDVYSQQGLYGIRAKVRYPGYVPDEHLAALYSRALALVYPSLYEGFGLPILEAMACGTPVIAADIDPLRGLVGEAGRLVNPESVECLANAIREVVDNSDLRHHLGEKGLRRVQEFTWDKAAQTMWQILCTIQ